MPCVIRSIAHSFVILACFAITLIISPKTEAASNQPPGNIKFDGLVSPGEIEEMTDRPMAIKLRSGLFITKVRVAELQFDRKNNGVKFLKYASKTGRTTTVKATDVYSFWVGNQRYHLRYFPPTGQLYVINSETADEVAEQRLAASGRSMREQPDDEEQTEATTEHKAFLADAAGKLKDIGQFRIEETESTLIFTDYPPAATAGLRNFVDNLNAKLNQTFGIPRGDLVWRGKAVVAVFSSTARFAAFEERVMNNPNHGGRGGVRNSQKRFMQTAIAKKLDDNVARGLSWGYSLGFANRLHSTAKGAPWMNMGIANSVQFMLFPDRRRQASQRTSVTRRVKNSGSLLGLFDATKLVQESWPTCGQLVQFLVKSDPVAFSQMFRDVKLGVPPEEALKQNFGATKQELADRFGKSLGIAGVRP